MSPLRTPNSQLRTSSPRVWVLFVVALVIYLSNARHVGQVDGRATALMALSLAREGNVDLDEFPDYCREGVADRLIYVVRVGDHHYAKWSPVAAMIYAPFFAIPAWLGVEAEVPDSRYPSRTKVNKATLWIAKIAAAIVAALTAVVVLAIASRLCKPPAAMLLAVLYAFGTSAWPICAQDTWQHGPGVLMLSLGLLGVLRCDGKTHPATAIWAALCLGVAVAIRPTNGALALPLGVLLLMRSRPRWWPGMIAIGLIPVAGLVIFNELIFGAPLGGGYAGAYASSPWSTPLHLGVAGLMISASRGLLIFSPAMIFVPFGLWRGIRERGRRALAIALAAGCLVHLVIMSMWSGWFGGWSYGPRFLAEAMPAAIALLAMGVDRIWSARGMRVVLVSLVVVSIMIASLGCYVGVDDWHLRQEQQLKRPLSKAVWDWRESHIFYQARKVFGVHPPAPRPQPPVTTSVPTES